MMMMTHRILRAGTCCKPERGRTRLYKWNTGQFQYYDDNDSVDDDDDDDDNVDGDDEDEDDNCDDDTISSLAPLESLCIMIGP